MPNRDGTGPASATGNRVNGRGAGKQSMQGSKKCACTKCDYSDDHVQGAKCTSKVCPKCGAAMKGGYCK